MKSKRISEFVLSLCLSLSSLFTVAVPKVHAASYSGNEKGAVTEVILPFIVTYFIYKIAINHMRQKAQI